MNAQDVDRMCLNKVRYADKRAVQTQINLMQRTRGRHGRPEAFGKYPCPICKGWHLRKETNQRR